MNTCRGTYFLYRVKINVYQRLFVCTKMMHTNMIKYLLSNQVINKSHLISSYQLVQKKTFTDLAHKISYEIEKIFYCQVTNILSVQCITIIFYYYQLQRNSKEPKSMLVKTVKIQLNNTF